MDADEVPLPYISSEGGYTFPTRDLWDVHSDFLQDYVEDPSLYQDILEAFDPKLVAEWSDDDDERPSDWELFSEFVRHHARYMFWLASSRLQQEQAEWWEERPLRVLESLGEQVQAHGLVVALDPSTYLWRAQGHVGPELDGGATPSRMGTIPRHKAVSPNRMSAPGIAMFYGSMDRTTAVAEATRHGDPHWDHVTAARFTSSRPLTVLDLTKLSVPPEPSAFRDDHDPEVLAHWSAVFLKTFVDSVGRPVSTDTARRNIEYVPTQVFTEFVLHAMGRDASPPLRIDGIVYPSVEVEGGTNIVVNRPRFDAAPMRVPAPVVSAW